jgi:hypothetical protein
MSTLAMITEAMKNRTLETLQGGEQGAAWQVARDYLATIRGLDRKSRPAYFGFENFLKVVEWFFSTNPGDDDFEERFSLLKNDWAEATELHKNTPNWSELLEALKTWLLSGNDPYSVGFNNFEPLSAVCSVSREGSRHSEKAGGITTPRIISASLYFLLETSIGCIFYAVLAAAYYLIFANEANAFVEAIMNFVSTLPKWLGTGLIYSFFILNGLIILSGFHFAVCGIGKIHYAFGTQGYMLKFLLAILLALPGMLVITETFFSPSQLAILPFLYLTGRGLRRTLAGELVVVKAIN